ncbi:O-antigen ligase family protein [Natranaerofaba carboxydovora]|uniref:O-antigen ligase family protein n=1 Tax=Natranaerofaba carboxydovora TaxID=2742683 RepID=UPI001F13B421|nr:O-antigen ligase family protein [Natranaerofaba carboxydovora]UMZ74703.1 O-Antigen ligase [Natranaerofaba carboxydovora]
MTSKNKKKNNKDKKIKETEIKPSIMRYVVIVLVAITLIHGLFYRGLFFDGEMLLTQAAVFFIFLLFVIHRLMSGETGFLSTPLDYVLLLFSLIYGVSIIVAVVPREAVLEFMAVATYFAVFLMVSRLSNIGFDRWFLYALIIGASVMTVISLGTGFGSFDYPGAVSGSRIFGTLQYPNTTAALLTAAFFVTLSRMQLEKKIWLQGLMGSASFIILITFVFTMSRAAWMLFPIVVIIYWAMNIRRFVSVFVYTAIPGIMFLVVSMPVWTAVQENQNTGWIYIIIGLVGAFGLTYLATYFFNRIKQLEKRSVQYGLAGFLVVVMLASTIFAALNYDRTLEMMPDAISGRIERIDFEETGFTTRIELMQVAWDITTDRPILGAGGGGWESLYFQYMDRDYTTTEVHSHLFQVGVETGIPGMLIFSTIWIALLYQMIMVLKHKKSESEEYIKATGVFVAAIALGGHSIVDFNLSLGAVAIYLWALFGLLNHYYLDSTGSETVESFDVSPSVSFRLNKLFPYVSMAAAFGLVIYSLVVYNGFSAGRTAHAFLQQGDAQRALSSLNNATSNDHLNADHYMNLAELYKNIYEQNQEGRYIPMAIDNAERALELKPYHPTNLADHGSFMLSVGKIEEGLDSLKKSNEYYIHNYNSFLRYSNGLIFAAEHYMFNEDPNESTEKAHSKLQKAIDLRDEFLDYHSEDRTFDLNVFKAYVLMEDFEGAESFMNESELPEDNEERYVFEAITYKGLGDLERAEEVFDRVEDEDERKGIIESYESYISMLGLEDN